MPGGDGDDSLDRLERWMREAVTSVKEPPGDAAGEVIVPLPNLDPAKQVHIYRDAWFSRLRECLEEDFPAVAHALGREGFSRMAADYLRACPSRSYNISRAGDRFEAFLAGREGLEHREFLVELARLEWAVCEMVDREAAPPLAVEELQGIPPERFEGARFVKAESAEVYAFAHPVNAYFQAVRDGREPPVPGPGPSAVAVYREGDRVWRLDLTPPMHAMLGALLGGATLGEAVERCAAETGSDPDWLATVVGGWFHEWATGGMFARIDLG